MLFWEKPKSEIIPNLGHFCPKQEDEYEQKDLKKALENVFLVNSELTFSYDHKP
jgi:hypothetical protein